MNILRLVLISLLFMIAGDVSAQSANVAIYVTTESKKKCENELLNTQKKKYCLAPRPVLNDSDISHITELKIDLANEPFFNLVFTELGTTKLRNLSVAFPNTEIVLVTDQLVIGELTDLDKLKSNYLKIGMQNGNDVDFVFQKLKAVVPVRK